MDTKLGSCKPFGAVVKRAVLALCPLLGILSGAAWAQEVPPDLPALAQTWVQQAVATVPTMGRADLQIKVQIGNVDPRLRLAACSKVEPYLPPGARLWGASRLGLRCVDGVGRWNISIPITVKAMGMAWVLRDQVLAGAVLGPRDVVQTEVDWAEDPSPVLLDQNLWVGQVASRLLTAGQTLRQSMVKPAQVFQAGVPVRVLASGAGFEVYSEGQSLTPGVVGQTARVKMDSGRMTTGIVMDARTVKVEF